MFVQVGFGVVCCPFNSAVNRPRSRCAQSNSDYTCCARCTRRAHFRSPDGLLASATLPCLLPNYEPVILWPEAVSLGSLQKMFIVEDFTKGKAGKGAGRAGQVSTFPGEGHVQQKFWSDERVELIELIRHRPLLTSILMPIPYLMDMDTVKIGHRPIFLASRRSGSTMACNSVCSLTRANLF